jgi:hypothetical protein
VRRKRVSQADNIYRRDLFEQAGRGPLPFKKSFERVLRDLKASKKSGG